MFIKMYPGKIVHIKDAQYFDVWSKSSIHISELSPNLTVVGLVLFQGVIKLYLTVPCSSHARLVLDHVLLF